MSENAARLPTYCLAWAPSGRSLFVGSLGVFVEWSRRGARVLKGPPSLPLYVIAVSPDERLIGLGTESKAASLVARDGKRVAKLSGDSGIVSHLSFDAASAHVLAGRALFDLEGKPAKRKTFSMMSLFVSEDLVASAGPDHDADQKSPALHWMRPSGERVRISALAKPLRFMATDGELVAVTDGESNVDVFRIDGERIAGFRRHVSGHTVSGLSVSQGRIASGGYGDRELWITDAEGKVAHRIEGYARPTQGNGVAFARHAPNWLAALGGELGAGGGGDLAFVHDLDGGGRIRLIATKTAWLAVDSGGRFVGDAGLCEDAKIETPGLLDAVLAAACGAQ